MHTTVYAVNLIYICIYSPSDPVAFWNWSATDLVGSVKEMTYRKFALKTWMATELQHTLKKAENTTSSVYVVTSLTFHKINAF